MLNNPHYRKHFWKYSTLGFSIIFFLLDEIFIYGLSFIPEEYRLLIHRSGLFIIVVGFIAWTQYALNRITTMSKQMLHSAKLSTLGEMAASVAHDIIHPIAVVDMQVQLNLRKNLGTPESIKFNKFIKKQMEKCTSIVDSLRMYGRNSISSQKELNDINSIILETLNLTGPYLSLTEVKQNLSENLSPILSNALQLEQVLVNILMNAKDALSGDKNNCITIRSCLDNGQISVEIEDNGEGISKADLILIFEPFHTTKSEGKGTGLGLAISKRIIDDHGGRITVNSRPGKTVFKITFPANS